MIERSKIERVREKVKESCKEWDWHYHVVPVTKYAKELARKTGSDEQLAELGGLLHDIGRIKFGTEEDHAVTGIPEAERILKELNYPQEVIDEIKHCVESHRGSGTVKPKTATAAIVANADTMAHFDTVPILIQLGLLNENNDITKAVVWVRNKLDRSYKKLTIPEAKRMVEEKYRAAMLLLDAMEQHAPR